MANGSHHSIQLSSSPPEPCLHPLTRTSPAGLPYPADTASELRALTHDQMVSNLEFHLHKAVDFSVARLRAQGSGGQQIYGSREEEEDEMHELQSLVFWRSRLAKSQDRRG